MAISNPCGTSENRGLRAITQGFATSNSHFLAVKRDQANKGWMTDERLPAAPDKRRKGTRIIIDGLCRCTFQ